MPPRGLLRIATEAGSAAPAYTKAHLLAPGSGSSEKFPSSERISWRVSVDVPERGYGQALQAGFEVRLIADATRAVNLDPDDGCDMCSPGPRDSGKRNGEFTTPRVESLPRSGET